MPDADVIVVGAGLAGQAFWSLGGLFLVDTPEQRRLRICDSPELALHDWLGSAGFARGSVTLRFRHRVDMLCTNGGALAGVSGTVLEPSSAGRGQPSSRTPVGEFDLSAPAVIVTSGGLGANHELVREAWPSTLGRPPGRMLSGVPDHVEGRMLKITRDARAPDEDRLRLQLVRAHAEDHRARVRAVGLRAEPRPDIEEHAPGAREPDRQGRPGAGELEREIRARDREMANPYAKDLQITAIHGARRCLPDRVRRVASPHRILDPGAGPLIAVRLWILTRKTLGGLETDVSGRVLGRGGEPLPGPYAAGEVAGFGGGVHGYRALEGTFLAGCLFSGRTAGRAGAQAVG